MLSNCLAQFLCALCLPSYYMLARLVYLLGVEWFYYAIDVQNFAYNQYIPDIFIILQSIIQLFQTGSVIDIMKFFCTYQILPMQRRTYTKADQHRNTTNNDIQQASRTIANIENDSDYINQEKFDNSQQPLLTIGINQVMGRERRQQKQDIYFYDHEIGIVWAALPQIIYPQHSQYHIDPKNIHIAANYENKFKWLEQQAQYAILKDIQKYQNKQIRKIIKLQGIPRNASEEDRNSLALGNIKRGLFKGCVQNMLVFSQNSLIDISHPPNPGNRIQHKRSTQLASTLKVIFIAYCQTLLMSHNQNPCIISIISHITFPSLKHINLSHNKIVSIDGLTYIRAQNLQTLQLNNNLLTSARLFQRITSHCGKLTQICLFDNYVNDFYDGNNCNIMAKAQLNCLKVLKLDMFATSRVNIQNIASLVKCQIQQSNPPAQKQILGQDSDQYVKQQFKLLYVQSKRRIGVHTLAMSKIFKQKFASLKMKSNIKLPRLPQVDQFNF